MHQVSLHSTQWRDVWPHFPMKLLEFYFDTIPLEITRTQVEKLLTASWRRRTSSKKHKFLIKCCQIQSMMITKLTQKHCPLERSMLMRLSMQRGQRSTCSSRGILFKSSNAPNLIPAKNSRPNRCKCFHSNFFHFWLSTCI